MNPVAAAIHAPDSATVVHLDVARSALGSDRSVAVLLGVSPSQVSRWRRGQEPDPDNADRLAGLALVVEMLSRWIDPDLVAEWLEGANGFLGGRSPAYMLRHGRVADVVGAVEAEKAGAFA